ncbi:Hypothetical predicted protein [Octopus vulgaris]|uniref:Uncharacterized protein n=1 Tax=Octopus vulgaris TaxID=6645 RepID=A0AA36F5L1_OCTVU|nr:Hypothetical predicted protein [Octopus vulgaris]
MFAGEYYTNAFIETVCGLQNNYDLGYAEITLNIISALSFGVGDYGLFKNHLPEDRDLKLPAVNYKLTAAKYHKR